jgi:hypothetical protein
LLYSLLLARTVDTFEWRRIDVIHREFVATGLPAGGPWTANERHDLGAHDIPSHIAMASRPAKARDIKQAVMLASRQTRAKKYAA